MGRLGSRASSLAPSPWAASAAVKQLSEDARIDASCLRVAARIRIQFRTEASELLALLAMETDEHVTMHGMKNYPSTTFLHAYSGEADG